MNTTNNGDRIDGLADVTMGHRAVVVEGGLNTIRKTGAGLGESAAAPFRVSADVTKNGSTPMKNTVELNTRKATPLTISMVGERFENLTVIGLAEVIDKTKRDLKCRCDCGAIVYCVPANLRSGGQKSCGCRKRALCIENLRKFHAEKGKSIKHGHNKRGAVSPTYHSWICMRTRCLNPRMKSFANYGGRGIRICDRWSSFANFLMDMGERPLGTTIDRIDSNGHYEPSNCRWADAKTQSNNTRAVKRIEWEGHVYTMTDFARLLGIPVPTAHSYLVKKGMTAREIVQKVQGNKSAKGVLPC